ncbi:MAG: DEAD/DEAH box helicase, partial [Acinetobacter sp.]
MDAGKTTYEQAIQNLESPSFEAIIRIAKSQLRENFSEQEIQSMYDELRRGTAVIDREELLWRYLWAFGAKHQAKIFAALRKIKNFNELVGSAYTIVDWGCGQGLATGCLFDYIKKNEADNAVESVYLVEPSELALKNAVLHTGAYGVRRIVPINKYLDDVTPDDIATDTDVTIHLFSNILDVEGFSLKRLAQTIGANAKGEHYFICVSPIYSSNHRIEAFYKYFAESDTIAQAEESVNEVMVLADEQHDSTVDEKFTMQLLIFKYISGKSYVIKIEYYPPVQFFAGAELDCVRKKRKSFSKEESLRWSSLMMFEVAAPFDLGASVYDDVHPVLAVLNNMVTRGLPTRTSPFIEDSFSCFGNSLIHDELGGVEYGDTLSDNRQEKIAQFYSPIGVARIQKTILEALLTGVLSISHESWQVLVRERDVPCAAMAFADLKNMFNHICLLSKDFQSMKLPEVRLTIICENEWVDSLLHLGVCAQAALSASIRNTVYDIVIDVSISSSTNDDVDPFSEFKCKNNCYFIIGSEKKARSKRRIYTSDTIHYLPIGEKNSFGEFKESKIAKEHLVYFLKLLFRKTDFRPGQIPILDRALQNKNVIGLLPTGGGKSLTYQFAAMMQPGVTIVIDPLRALMKDQYDGLCNMGIDACSFINSTLGSKERGRRERRLESSELQFIFLSPERLCIYKFREKLKTMHEMHIYFAYGVIDEVHCVSEWGHDFRFSYLHLGRNMYNYVCAKDENKRLTLFGLTATASFDVLSDVERELSGNGAYPLDA